MSRALSRRPAGRGGSVTLEAPMSIAGLIVGFMVGLTGMGGGALMTPILVLLFRIDPLAAVSSALVASFVMKPVGAGVHFRRGTVNLHLVRWLAIGSVPSAFAGVLLLDALGADEVQSRLKTMLGVVLIAAAAAMVVKGLIRRPEIGDPGAFEIRRLPPIPVGAGGGG